MGDRAWCPGCDSETSGVLIALRDGEPCPYCGLPAETIVAVTMTRQRYKESELRTEHEATLIRLARAEEHARKLEQFLRDISDPAQEWAAYVASEHYYRIEG